MENERRYMAVYLVDVLAVFVRVLVILMKNNEKKKERERNNKKRRE